MSVLVLNTGSSSVKFELFEGASPSELRSVAAGLVEGIGEAEGHMGATLPDGGRVDRDGVVADHREALESVMTHLADALTDLVAVGHRVVHGGEHFTEPTVIDDAAVEVIDSLSPLAPLHNPPALEGIRVARELRPEIPHVAVFDTAFHATLPPAAYRYAVPTSWYADHGVRRYGFHGTSHRYVAEQAAQSLGRPLEDLRTITLHLGNGASACAIDGGRSIDTSMGLSPLEGLVMGTRSGDLDPAVVFHMIRAGMSPDDVERALNRQSGLRGLAADNDMRRVHRAADAGDEGAQLALEVTAHRLRKYVGAYAAVLGGLDALVFTAGIGEHSPAVRAAVVEPLGHLGLTLDVAANAAADAADGPVRISRPDASPAVLVVATDEERMIAAEALRALAG
ncbi:acetate/propionate family kinase [Euzebya sp.]|uniref:acetate/propionate family kinase n=1 Tax=Euzebya sp. TaxID=1971409 RepID=UPI0035158FC6